MSKLAPETTDYGIAAQQLETAWDKIAIPESVSTYDLSVAINVTLDLLNQAHIHDLAHQAQDAERIEAAAAALFDARYNPRFLRGLGTKTVEWANELDWIQAIYRADAETMLRAAGCLGDPS